MTKTIEEIADEARRLTVKMIAEAKAPHIGSCLSVIDILVFLYFDAFDKELEPANAKKKDAPHIILSKGHAVAALYSVLYLKGYIEKKQISTFHKNGGMPGHADTSIAGVDFSTGSLGHGLSVAVGMALAARMNGRNNPIIAVMGDGECQEGEVWEAANFAAAKKVNNLIAIIDHNMLQAYGRSDELGGGLKEKWASFGWNVILANGHNFVSLQRAMKKALSSQVPSVIIADTIKGRGLGELEGKIESHYRSPKGNELDNFRNW